MPPLAAKYVGKFKGHGKDAGLVRAPGPLPPPPPRTALAYEHAGTLAQVGLICRVPGHGPDTTARLLVTQAAARRALFEALRTAGGSYAPEADVAAYGPDAGVLEMWADVSLPDAGNAAVAMLGVIDGLASGSHDAFVRGAAREAQADWGRRFASAADARGALAIATTWNFDPSQFAGLQDAIGAVDAAAVADTVRDCAGHEVITAIGPGAAARLTEAGLEARDVPWTEIGRQVVDSLR